MPDPTPTPTTSSPSAEELQAQIEELQRKNQALEATRSGLLEDLVKRKQVDNVLKSAGINIADPSFDPNAVAELITRAVATPQSQPQPTSQPQPMSQPSPAAGEAGGGLDDGIKAQLASFQNEINRLKEANESIQAEKERERKMRLEEYKRTQVMSAFTSENCQKPDHLFRLTGDDFRLLEDENTVVFGPGEEVIALRDAVQRLRDSEEFGMYFAQPAVSGSGLPPTRMTLTSAANNPFKASTSNATEATRIAQKDPAQARRLINAARAAGDLDHRLEAAFRGI